MEVREKSLAIEKMQSESEMQHEIHDSLSKINEALEAQIDSQKATIASMGDQIASMKTYNQTL